MGRRLFSSFFLRGCIGIITYVRVFKNKSPTPPPLAITVPTSTHPKTTPRQDPAFQPPALHDAIFDITVISGQRWLLFAEPPITLEWTRDGRMTALETYTGALTRCVCVCNV